MTQGVHPRGIAVLDIGSTNVKLSLFDNALRLLDERSIASRWVEGDYLFIDFEPVLSFAKPILAEFDRMVPVDVIVPASHGSALALLDGDGELALPIMAYEAQPPVSICEEYARIEPAFEEVLAPTNPGALTLGRQLLWQQTMYRDAFDRVRTIVPLAQYAAYRFTGKLATEVSALGAQTHLWDPVRRRYSGLARSRGWAALFAPLEPAWCIAGVLREPLPRGKGQVLVGVHDSNANFLRYRNTPGHCVVSTGTWIIAFDPSVPMESLDPAADQVSNTTVHGDPVACCRFMGGREHAELSAGTAADSDDIDTARQLVAEGVMAMPAFTDSGGPLPHAGGKGHVRGKVAASQRPVLASLYCAQMTALALDRMGASRDMIVDGPFANNHVFCSALSGCRDGRVILSRETNGTALGAATLALAEPVEPSLEPMPAASIDGLQAYHARWLEHAGVERMEEMH